MERLWTKELLISKKDNSFIEKGDFMNVLMIGPARNVKGGITTVVNSYFEAGLDKKVNLKYIETTNDKNIILKGFKMIKGYIEFLLSIDKYDIVHIHTASRRSFWRKRLYINKCYKKKKKIIVHIHGGAFKNFYEESNNNRKKRIIETLNKANKIIVLSKEWKNFFGKIVDENKIEVIYNSVEVPEDFKKDFGKKRILFLGRFDEKKGIFDLLDVMTEIAKIDSDAKLYIGSNERKEKVNKIIKEYKLNNNVEYLGWVDEKLKKEVLKEATIFVLPSYYEGMPMSVLEAMAYKNIVISTNVGGIPEIIENGYNGFLIEPGDKKELFNKIEKIINSDKKNEMSDNARATVNEMFNIDINICKLLDLYDQIKNMKMV